MAPVLSDAPMGVVEHLGQVAKSDPDVAAWLIDLDRFYQKQDIARGSGIARAGEVDK